MAGPLASSLPGGPSTGALWPRTWPLPVAEGSILDCHVPPRDDVNPEPLGKKEGESGLAFCVAERPSLVVRWPGFALDAGTHESRDLGQAIASLSASVSPLRSTPLLCSGTGARDQWRHCTLAGCHAAPCPVGPPRAHRLEGHGDPLHAAIFDTHGPM